MNEAVDPVAQWLDAAAERRLVLQRCSACGHYQHYPRELCTSCGSDALAFAEVEGTGTVRSYSVVARSPDPERFSPPYTVALVQLAEGPVLFTRLVGIDAPECDMTVGLDWWEGPEGQALPVFTSI